MKKITKWFVEFTKDSSATRNENNMFRVNVLASWVGGLFAIIAFCGLCFTSCTNQEEMKKADSSVQSMIDTMECGQSLNLLDATYGYLLKRLRNQNGIVQFGNVNYNVWERRDGLYILTDKDYEKSQESHFLVTVNHFQASPSGGTLRTMGVRKICGSYYYPIEIDGFELNLQKYDEYGYLTIYIKNVSGEPFAYAEQTQLNSNSVTDKELIFVQGNSCKIEVRDISRLILYEYEGDDNVKKLKKKSYIHYLAHFFRL